MPDIKDVITQARQNRNLKPQEIKGTPVGGVSSESPDRPVPVDEVGRCLECGADDFKYENHLPNCSHFW